MSKDIREMRKIIEGLFDSDDNEHTGSYEVCQDCFGEGCEACEHGLKDVTGEFKRPDFDQFESEDLLSREQRELATNFSRDAIEENDMDKDLYDLRKLAGLHNEEGTMSPFSSGDENVEEVREGFNIRARMADALSGLAGKDVIKDVIENESQNVIDQLGSMIPDEHPKAEAMHGALDELHEYLRSSTTMLEFTKRCKSAPAKFLSKFPPGDENVEEVREDDFEVEEDYLASPKEAKPRGKYDTVEDDEFDAPDDRIVDVGDDEDFDEFDFQDEYARSGYRFNEEEEEIEEDLGNGYEDQHTADGQDYFPKGATSSPTRKAGPGGAKHGDNPMYTSVKVDEATSELHEKYIREYADYVKADRKKNLVEGDMANALEALRNDALEYIRTATYKFIAKLPYFKRLEQEMMEQAIEKEYTDFCANMSDSVIDTWIADVRNTLVSEHPSSVIAFNRRAQYLKKLVGWVKESESPSQFEGRMEVLNRYSHEMSTFIRKSNKSVSATQRRKDIAAKKKAPKKLSAADARDAEIKNSAAYKKKYPNR